MHMHGHKVLSILHMQAAHLCAHEERERDSWLENSFYDPWCRRKTHQYRIKKHESWQYIPHQGFALHLCPLHQGWGLSMQEQEIWHQTALTNPKGTLRN